MPEYRPDQRDEDLPPASPELVLFRIHVEALLPLLSRKKGERYLQAMGEAFETEENLSSIFQIRPTTQHASVRMARKQAAEIFRRMLPIFMARLPRK